MCTDAYVCWICDEQQRRQSQRIGGFGGGNFNTENFFMLDDNISFWEHAVRRLRGEKKDALTTRVDALRALHYLQEVTALERHAVAGFEKTSQASDNKKSFTEQAFVYKAVLIDTAQCAGIDFICGLQCAEDIDFLHRVQRVSGLGGGGEASTRSVTTSQRCILKVNRPIVIKCSVLSRDKVQKAVPLWDELIMPWRTDDSENMHVAQWEIDALQCLELWIHKLRIKGGNTSIAKSVERDPTSSFRAVMLEIDALAKSLLGGIANPVALAMKDRLTHLHLRLSPEVFAALQVVTQSLLHLPNSTAGLVDQAINVAGLRYNPVPAAGPPGSDVVAEICNLAKQLVINEGTRMDGALVWLLFMACDGIKVIRLHCKKSIGMNDDTWRDSGMLEQLRKAFLSGLGSEDDADHVNTDNSDEQPKPLASDPEPLAPDPTLLPTDPETLAPDPTPLPQDPTPLPQIPTPRSPELPQDPVPLAPLDLKPLVDRLLKALQDSDKNSLAGKAIMTKRFLNTSDREAIERVLRNVVNKTVWLIAAATEAGAETGCDNQKARPTRPTRPYTFHVIHLIHVFHDSKQSIKSM